MVRTITLNDKERGCATEFLYAFYSCFQHGLTLFSSVFLSPNNSVHLNKIRLKSIECTWEQKPYSSFLSANKEPASRSLVFPWSLLHVDRSQLLNVHIIKKTPTCSSRDIWPNLGKETNSYFVYHSIQIFLLFHWPRANGRYSLKN